MVLLCPKQQKINNSISGTSAGYRQLEITIQYSSYLKADDRVQAIRVTMLLQHFKNDRFLAMETEISMRIEQNILKTNGKKEQK